MHRRSFEGRHLVFYAKFIPTSAGIKYYQVGKQSLSYAKYFYSCFCVYKIKQESYQSQQK